jgi:hypothetical protein
MGQNFNLVDRAEQRGKVEAQVFQSLIPDIFAKLLLKDGFFGLIVEGDLDCPLSMSHLE